MDGTVEGIYPAVLGPYALLAMGSRDGKGSSGLDLK